MSESPWIIVMTGARSFIGQATDTDYAQLEPVYELHRGVVVGPSPERKGAVSAGVRTQVVPVDGLLSLKRLVFSTGPVTSIVKLDDLDRADRDDIMRHVRACEDMLRHMRANAAGIRPALVMPGAT